VSFSIPNPELRPVQSNIIIANRGTTVKWNCFNHIGGCDPKASPMKQFNRESGGSEGGNIAGTLRHRHDLDGTALLNSLLIQR